MKKSTPEIPSLNKKEFFEDPGLPIQVHMRDPQPIFPLHRHNFDELVIILKGTATHAIDGQQFTIRGGDAFVIAESREHEYRDMHHLVLANVLFDRKSLKMDDWDIRALPGFHALFSLEPAFRAQHNFQSRLQLSERQLSHINELVHDLQHELSVKSPGYRVMVKGIFMQLVVYLSRCYSEKTSEESLDLLRIGEAIAYIETHYTEKIEIEALATMAHMSRRHFQRIFQQCMNKTPIEHLQNIRIQKAADLLRHTDRTITDIAFECGFSDSNYFTRCFRKVMETTPLKYRQQPRV